MDGYRKEFRNERSRGAISHPVDCDITTCPHCDADTSKFYVAQGDPLWHDGDVICGECGERVRSYVAG